MENNKLDILISDLIGIGPLFRKKFMNNYRQNCNKLNHSQFHVLLALKEIGTCPISEVAKKLGISTPNMTKILNKLIEEDFINRVHDTIDRRIVNISLTEKGNKYLESDLNELKNIIKEKLINLDETTIEKLLESITTLKDVLSDIN